MSFDDDEPRSGRDGGRGRRPKRGGRREFGNDDFGSSPFSDPFDNPAPSDFGSSRNNEGGYRGGGGGGYRGGGDRPGGGGGFRGGGDRPPRQPMQIEKEGLTGTVKFFNQERGFGFITPDEGGDDVFVHISSVERSGLPGVEDGMKLIFDLAADARGKGPKAVNLKPIDGAADAGEEPSSGEEE
ncbi:cold-shock protein [Ponticaulis sp.]|uniref:cold-shock protein n=1 Tax=Ponticaulis sp. TaxID=2020902 RepID=UPI000C5BCD5A|nr:DNA-binding protein [Ponticaulis sp.]